MLKAAPLGKLAVSYDQQSLGTKWFSPSTVAVREHRARERADRITEQFVTRFKERDYIPDGGDNALFALLVQLPDWPADLSINVVDEDGEPLAIYLKGRDGRVVRHTILLAQSGDDSYVAPGNVSVSDEESLLQLVLSQLPAGSTLATGGDFPGSASMAGRIVTLREQVAGLALTQRPLLFDALLADCYATKDQSPASLPNPFLPFWSRSQAQLTPLLSMLHVLSPEVPLGRLEELLERLPVSTEEEAVFLESGLLPDPFVEAMSISLGEWSCSVAIDGVLRTRIYNPHADLLARECARQMLANRLGRELVILEAGMDKHVPTGPDDSRVVLLHDDAGNYRALHPVSGEITEFKKGTDSFYMAISSLLQPHERSLMGMQFEHDVEGFRHTLTLRAIEENGGWFDPQKPTEIDSGFLPEWFKDASTHDRLSWKTAVQDYSQALLEAQAPDLLDPQLYGSREQLRKYAREKLEERIALDHGIAVNADEIVVETIHSEMNAGGFFDTDYVYVGPSEVETHYTAQRRSLTDLCLENITVTNINFLLTSRAFDSDDRLIGFLNAGYLFRLVRDLDIGEDYPRFLRFNLSTSPSGQWHRERYARVMQAQMRLDAIEARMAGDFVNGGGLPSERAHRSYKWVTAVLNNPLNDHRRERVEGHPVEVHRLQINGAALRGILVIGTASRASVASLVLFTPQAPDGKCFRELSNPDDLLRQVLHEPVLLDYLVSRAALSSRSDIRHALTAARHSLYMDLVPCVGNFLEAVYDAEVEWVVEAVDEQTTSTWESNWESVWEITRTVGEFALTFAPFKVRLPIAAIRSFHAIWQGIEKAADNDTNASLYFVQAALLLADGLTLPKGRRVKPASATSSGFPVLDPSQALLKTPAGLTLRGDGIYKGVYEKIQEGAAARYYTVQAGKAYAVRYDSSFSTWRVIDARRPDAYYQMPIRLNEQGSWTYAPVGLRGGKKTSKAKPSDGSGDKGGSSAGGAKKLFQLDLDNFFEGSAFRKAQKNIEGDLTVAVKKAVERYRVEGKGNLHPSKHGLYSLDLPGVGRSTGRGAWRLMFEPPKNGVMKAYGVMDPH
ncbi:dermonecrotic toxin domain-containing protein [Pseudomonas viridiflava]|uniref:Dermonecrotic toxin N-terminal domain-containing protein n=1 Tax=Pseudomonas viridiflava TaxID=33069 RepID=A0A3M5P4E7_PSEVI|nr:DUF6543 domain-containing protein [Pseudomonas viridiflava]RMT79590.1 hypothetical protein ALP40_03717 [Pseudomonas viridiflava]